MQELFLINMYIPEYSITPQILKNISNIEYGKAIIENTALLPNWQKQLEKDAMLRTLAAELKSQNINSSIEQIKKYIDGLDKNCPSNIKSILETIKISRQMAKNIDFDEDTLKVLHGVAAKGVIDKTALGAYRSRKLVGTVTPESILAEIVEFFDWYSSRDAKETHPILVAAIVKARLETVQPFDHYNSLIANAAVQISMAINSYGLNYYISLEDRYSQTKNLYDQYINTLKFDEPTLTLWIEYFTEEMAREVYNLKEKVSLLARDTKIAKASGRIRLSKRRERIIEYLQDYMLLQNKDFPVVFPDVSEDSILRDLKALISQGIVSKTGSTKSSRYELS
jgi:hypothetical protein